MTHSQAVFLAHWVGISIAFWLGCAYQNWHNTCEKRKARRRSKRLQSLREKFVS